jgi:hypothetical protein
MLLLYSIYLCFRGEDKIAVAKREVRIYSIAYLGMGSKLPPGIEVFDRDSAHTI